jgi:Fe-S-cluster containining protein
MVMNPNDACRKLVRALPDGPGRTAALFAQMDAAYDSVARHYGFVCSGCEDNCCRTRFRHHTLIEFAYLKQGFGGLDQIRRRKIEQRAYDYRQALQNAETLQAPFRRWCPLNHDGRCVLYPFRPMICRLHGLPHVLRHPAKGLIQGPGCHMLAGQCRDRGFLPLDRSGLYQTLAGLERDARQASGFNMPIRMTIADMVLDFGEDMEDLKSVRDCG